MTTIRLRTLWKSWEGESIELLFALDEETVENNYRAWEDGLKSACERYKIAESDTRVAIVEIPAEPITALFAHIELDGRVIQ